MGKKIETQRLGKWNKSKEKTKGIRIDIWIAKVYEKKRNNNLVPKLGRKDNQDHKINKAKDKKNKMGLELYG